MVERILSVYVRLFGKSNFFLEKMCESDGARMIFFTFLYLKKRFFVIYFFYYQTKRVHRKLTFISEHSAGKIIRGCVIGYGR